MSRYFRFFPQESYQVANSSFEMQRQITDITLRTRIIDNIGADDPYLYLPYTVKEGERAEDVANFYYGSPDYVWLVWFSNDIVDPYNEWPRSQPDLKKFIIKKYQDQSGSQETLAWTQNTLITENIKHYKKSDGTLASPDSYTLKATFDPDYIGGEWTPVRFYDYEFEHNEEKRDIRLVNESYRQLAQDNLRDLLQ